MMRDIITWLLTAGNIRRIVPASAVFAFIIGMLMHVECMAQIPIHHDVVMPMRPEAVDSAAYYEKKHFWRAAGETVGFNIGLWAFDRYVQRGDFAYISWHSIKENFRHGFIWDNDKLGTNTFLHPYNGSLYFNAGRANGFNFWQSELFAVAGSGMWEMFMENEYPSTNDFIATPIGGAAIGEPLFRASDAVIDNRASGAERVGREIAAFIINPMRGFNRIITGEAWRRQATSGKIFGHPRVAVRLSAGTKVLELQGHVKNATMGFAAQFDLEYGDRFESLDYQRPYDYFTVQAELQGMKGQPVLNKLEIKGRLIGWELLKSYRTHASVGLYQHFDFYDSDTIGSQHKVPFKLGIPASIGVGVMFRDVQRRNVRFDAYAHLNGILLGSVLSDHYFSDERNYNWAQGFSFKTGLNLVLSGSRLSFSVTNEFYRLYTWKGYARGIDPARADYRTLNVMGDKSDSFFNVTDARLDILLHKRLYFTVGFTNYARYTRYRDFPDVRSSSMALRFMLSYKL